MSDNNLIGQVITIEFEIVSEYTDGTVFIRSVDLPNQVVKTVIERDYALRLIEDATEVELPQPRQGPL